MELFFHSIKIEKTAIANRKSGTQVSYALPNYHNRQLHGSYSKSGKDSKHPVGLPSPAQESCSMLDLDLCPDLLMGAIAAAAAVAFYIIYEAISLKGKRKRSFASSIAQKMSLGNILDGFYIGNKSSLLFLTVVLIFVAFGEGL